MRLALIGAFPFPYPQGSQIYLAEQARALHAVGAEPVLLTYGRSRPAAAGVAPPGMEWIRSADWLSPKTERSGPSWMKPVADAALAATLLAAHRRRRFDAVLAHNAEAAVIAVATRAITGVPLIYVAHTLLRHELSAYASIRWRTLLDRAGDAIDRFIARHADGIIALGDDARTAMSSSSRSSTALRPCFARYR